MRLASVADQKACGHFIYQYANTRFEIKRLERKLYYGIFVRRRDSVPKKLSKLATGTQHERDCNKTNPHLYYKKWEIWVQFCWGERAYKGNVGLYVDAGEGL